MIMYCIFSQVNPLPNTVINIGTDSSEQTVDPDQMPQNVASDQDLHCLPLIQHYFRHINR